MSITRDQVRRIAWLGRIAIDESQEESYAKDLSGIIAFVEQMSDVDTGGIEPMAHPLQVTQRLRPDDVTEGDLRDLLQAHAPLVEAGLYLVPKVIE